MRWCESLLPGHPDAWVLSDERIGSHYDKASIKSCCDDHPVTWIFVQRLQRRGANRNPSRDRNLFDIVRRQRRGIPLLWGNGSFKPPFRLLMPISNAEIAETNNASAHRLISPRAAFDRRD